MRLQISDIWDAPPESLIDKYNLRNLFMRKIGPEQGQETKLICTLVRIIQPGEGRHVSLPEDFIIEAERAIRNSLEPKGFEVRFEPTRNMTMDEIAEEINRLAQNPC